MKAKRATVRFVVALLLFSQCRVSESAKHHFRKTVTKQYIRPLKHTSGNGHMAGASLLEKKLIEDQNQKCLNAVYIALGGDGKVACFPNSDSRKMMQELATKYKFSYAQRMTATKLSFQWMVHDGIEASRSWVDSENNLVLTNSSTSDSGLIACHVSIVKELGSSTDPDHTFKTFVFKRILITKAYPQFSSTAVLMYDLEDRCDATSLMVRPLLRSSSVYPNMMSNVNFLHN